MEFINGGWLYFYGMGLMVLVMGGLVYRSISRLEGLLERDIMVLEEVNRELVGLESLLLGYGKGTGSRVIGSMVDRLRFYRLGMEVGNWVRLVGRLVEVLGKDLDIGYGHWSMDGGNGGWFYWEVRHRLDRIGVLVKDHRGY